MGDFVSDIFGGGGGGGGGGSAAPASQTVTQTAELPEWARGYAKDALAKGQALTDISQNPYQRYGGQRIADFGDLQKQAFAQAGPAGFGANIGSYMSPYMQNVVDIQKREAARQSGIAGVQQAGQATQAGAFGGGRDAILRAERERNLMTQMGDIQQQGSQAAFDRATQQYNTGIGQLNTLGALQQAQAQRGLDIPYQEFLNEQNYPYKQLGFQSDLIRGLPLGQTSSKSVYEAAPSGAQQLASLGLGAYGLSKMMAEGGMAYADGGSVDAPDNIQRIVSKLSDQQLQQSAQAAQARGDTDQLEAIQSEMAMRASERNGLASAVTPEMADQMAGGGVVAFAKGGINDTLAQMSELAETDLAVSPEQRMAGISSALPQIQEMYGPSATAPYLREVKDERAKLSKMSDEGIGLGALAASQALLRPGDKSRAIAGAMGAFGAEVSKMKKEQREADRMLRQSELTLATAEQARKDGQIGKAESLYDKSQDQKKEGLNRKLEVLGKKATIEAGIKQAEIGAAATLGKKTDLERLTDAQYDALVESGAPKNAATRAEAGARATNMYGKLTGTARAEMAAGKDRIKVAESVDMMLMKPGVEKQRFRELQAADKAAGTNTAAEYRRSLIDAEMGVAPSGDKGGPAPAQQTSAAPQVPDLGTWLPAARKANPGVSDADLKAYYSSKYK